MREYPNVKAPIEVRAFEDAIRAVVMDHFNNFAGINVSINTTYEDVSIPELKLFRSKPRYELELTLTVDITHVPLTINTKG